jgi:glucose-1-phosphate cytidylyltransferase
VREFVEKPQMREGCLDGGFLAFQSDVSDCLHDESPLERGLLDRLAEVGELMAFCHDGFWQPMNTVRDRVRPDRAPSTSSER